MPRPTIKSRVDTLLGNNACGNRCPAANSVVLPATLGMSFCFEPWAGFKADRVFRLCMAQSFTSDWGLRLRRLRLQTSGPSLVHGMLRRLRLKVLQVVDGLLRLSSSHGLLMGLLHHWIWKLLAGMGVRDLSLGGWRSRGVGGIHKAQGSSASSHLSSCNHIMLTYLPQEVSFSESCSPCSQKPNPKSAGHTQTKRQPATPYCLRPIPQHEIPSPASYGSGFLKASGRETPSDCRQAAGG